ncbi:DUF1998 domain-containing protein [Sinomicrobium soli]|uniref:DUF1998 domain-containing protein n=1 Tax=Sinomicrobium sp. N-1-3-6 TaxID=2219864 RepID=UPI000DCF1897|nr:DUF1998 domain-containing protein [Sinomicrobium sp. N-1-3-6]RAV28519.1 hypothetical protein DN748_12940 [Sinomicrobium sp. N-1-3-6]
MGKFKYTETQTRKIISSYGGVESIIETPKGALKIELFEKWPFFRAIKEGKIEPLEFKVNDNRLLKRLQTQKGFPKLEEFLRVPPNQAHPHNKSIPADFDTVVSSEYFPKWFYCNNCERFNHLNKWWVEWKRIIQKHGGKAEMSDFIPPRCPYCYDKAKNTNKETGTRQRFFYDLEQVRFIMTAPTGEARDIPWEHWNKVVKKTKEQKDEGQNEDNLVFDWDNLCCDTPDFRYYKSKKFSDLAGIRIECRSCGSRKTLSGLFGLRIKVPNKVGIYFKPVLRTSNSCYYPILVSSIYLPTKRDIDIEDQKAIIEWKEEGEDLDFIYKALRKKYEKGKIEKFIQGEIDGKFEPETEYRLKEYNFITEPNRLNYPGKNSEDNNLVFDRIALENLNSYGLVNLTAIKRLKIATVQTAYTRQEPIDSDQFLSGETLEANIQPKYTSEDGNQTKYLPAIESFGEGIFVAFDDRRINEWLVKSFKNKSFSNRVKTLFDNSKINEMLSVQKKFQSERHLARFVLVHTFSHLLIKELEFLCGYPATSLNERLFVDEHNMLGVLIYTVAGTEGSYGGLVSQSTEQNFTRLLNSALYRATDCASDPICYNTEDGQGVGGLNMAACYSCTLVPENACEEFNSFLDRSLLIDSEYGFFKSNINT